MNADLVLTLDLGGVPVNTIDKTAGARDIFISVCNITFN